MKLRFRILSAVAAIFCLCAFPSCSQEPSSRIEVLEKAAETLSLVDSKETADFAAERVSALLASIEKFPETPDENLAAAQAASGRFLAQGLRLSKERFFESEELKKALGYAEKTEAAPAPTSADEDSAKSIPVPAKEGESITNEVPAVPVTAPENAPENAPADVPAEAPAETVPAENA